jgi:hypothetical protein
MHTATFTVTQRGFDYAFHALDQVIAETARSRPDGLREQSWESPAADLISNLCLAGGLSGRHRPGARQLR